MFYKDGELFTEKQIKELNPYTSFTSIFNPIGLGYEPVLESPKPTITDLQIAEVLSTELDNNGVRISKWTIRDMFNDYTDSDGVFHSKLDLEAQFLEQKRLSEVPFKISMRQARLILLNVGLLTNIDAIISTLGDAAKIEWEYATDIERTNPIVIEVTKLLNMTDRQMDDLFTAASKLI